MSFASGFREIGKRIWKKEVAKPDKDGNTSNVVGDNFGSLCLGCLVGITKRLSQNLARLTITERVCRTRIKENPIFEDK